MMEDNNILKCIRIMNDTNIEYKKRRNEDYSTDNVIHEMLKDNQIFSKISQEKAYMILRTLEIKNIDETYKKLINK